MTSPVETIKVKCPGCGKTYKDWHRDSINLALDDFDDGFTWTTGQNHRPFDHGFEFPGKYA